MFAYCLNNPVNMVDYAGNKPGDLFDTMDEAAIDFALCYNEKSISEMQEYGSFIYKVKTPIKETRTENIYMHVLFWNFKIGEYKYTVTVGYKTQYAYVKPNAQQDNNNVSIPFNWFWRRNKVADIHTHGALEEGFNKEDFSPTDLNGVEYTNYVATPYGTVRKYVPGQTIGRSQIIYEGAPYDVRMFDW